MAGDRREVNLSLKLRVWGTGGPGVDPETTWGAQPSVFEGGAFDLALFLSPRIHRNHSLTLTTLHSKIPIRAGLSASPELTALHRDLR